MISFYFISMSEEDSLYLLFKALNSPEIFGIKLNSSHWNIIASIFSLFYCFNSDFLTIQHFLLSLQIFTILYCMGWLFSIRGKKMKVTFTLRTNLQQQIQSDPMSVAWKISFERLSLFSITKT